jgi:hypothetical protein
MTDDRGTGERGRDDLNGPDGPDAGRFIRGLTIGLIVGAVIAGSTLWRRFGTFRKRG